MLIERQVTDPDMVCLKIQDMVSCSSSFLWKRCQRLQEKGTSRFPCLAILNIIFGTQGECPFPGDALFKGKYGDPSQKMAYPMNLV